MSKINWTRIGSSDGTRHIELRSPSFSGGVFLALVDPGELAGVIGAVAASQVNGTRHYKGTIEGVEMLGAR